MRSRRPNLLLRRAWGAAALTLAAFAATLTAAPAANASDPDGPIGRGETMDRSWSWVAEQVPYSWDGCHRNQFGCYRPDCSGFVSMAWNLGSSLTTWTLWNVTSDIPASDLQPGDALLRDDPDPKATHHVALFVRWADAGHTQPVVREEYDFGHVAEERTWGNGLRGFSPRRYNRLDDLMPYGSIRAKYDGMGGLNSPLGPPVTGERDSMMGGRFQQFRNGIIIWHPDAAFAIYGDILSKFWATDAERAWGFPTMDEADAAQAPNGMKGRYQFFERGLFLWSQQTGAHVVHGEIYKAFHNAGHEAALGYPMTDEVDEAGGGKAQKFQKSTIHWNPAKGTWITDN
ncbi:NlpC/P60 family protein [Streptomyces sp. NPDC001262]|uniref:NlpC/P60 family protein n=1 Tax=Streptomyces sp. NPDC001262 TaxID=3364552 RepID=UPI003692A24F